MNYRDRLYPFYISTHFGAIKEVSTQACENQCHQFRSYFKKHLPRNTKVKILDMGCGFGSFLYFLRKEGYQDVHGVEISPEQVAAAEDMGIPNVSCHDILEYLKAHPHAFDCVVALDVLEHFSKSEICDLIDLTFQALREGGRIIIQVPNGGSPFFGMIRYGDFTHETCFTKDSVVQILKVGGFINTRVFPTGPVVHGIKSGIRWCLWQLCNVLLKTYLVIETGTFRGHILSQNLIAVADKKLKIAKNC